MTKVGRLFEEEKLEAINEKMLEVAKKLLDKDVDILTIMESTGLRAYSKSFKYGIMKNKKER
jgi:hypothetical protein